jgi:hypothetical protein
LNRLRLNRLTSESQRFSKLREHHRGWTEIALLLVKRARTRPGPAIKTFLCSSSCIGRSVHGRPWRSNVNPSDFGVACSFGHGGCNRHLGVACRDRVMAEHVGAWFVSARRLLLGSSRSLLSPSRRSHSSAD